MRLGLNQIDLARKHLEIDWTHDEYKLLILGKISRPLSSSSPEG